MALSTPVPVRRSMEGCPSVLSHLPYSVQRGSIGRDDWIRRDQCLSDGIRCLASAVRKLQSEPPAGFGTILFDRYARQ